MKKFWAIILVLSLALAFPLSVSAATQIDQANHDIQITISKAAVAPVIDGKLDADSYQKIDIKQADLNLNSNSLDLTSIAFDAYISYDDNNVYVLLSGDERYHYCDHSPADTGNIWNQSCIQISLSANNTIAAGTERLEFGLARNNDGEFLSYVWGEAHDVGHGTAEYVIVDGQNAAIANDGGRLNYEVSVPWNAFLAGKPAVGEKFGFNFMYVWSADDIDVREKLEYSSGCDVSGKNADLFAQVTLTDNELKAAPPPAPEPEPVVEAPAPVEGVGGSAENVHPAPVVAAPAPVAVPQTGVTSLSILGVIGAAVTFGAIRRRK